MVPFRSKGNHYITGCFLCHGSAEVDDGEDSPIAEAIGNPETRIPTRVSFLDGHCA